MKTIRKIAAALLLAAAPSAPLAQTAQQPQAAPAAASEVAPPTTDSASPTSGETPTGPDNSRSTATVQEGETAPHQARPRAIEGQIVLQGVNTFLANELLGLTVYSAYGGAVGDVNDLLIGGDGSVAGIIIGMGGFLGIGEKQIAVELETLDVIPVQGGDLLLLLDARKDDLQAAPSFTTFDQQRATRKSRSPEAAEYLEQRHGLFDGPAEPVSSTQSE